MIPFHHQLMLPLMGGGGGGDSRKKVGTDVRLSNKGRYGCAASAKPKQDKISQKNLMPGQKRAQKPNDRASFHEL